MRQIKIDENDRPIMAKKSAPKKRKAAPKRKYTAKAKGSFLSKIRLPKMPDLSRLIAFAPSRKPSVKGRTKTKVKRRASQSWRRFAPLAGGTLVLAIAVGFTGYVMVRDAWFSKAGNWLGDVRLSMIEGSGLVVQEVSVVGRHRTNGRAILAALDVEQGDSLVDFDPDAARERVEALGWVEHAAVMRRYPDEVFVRIQERRPFARWQVEGETSVIDRKGMVVSDRNLQEFSHLPKVVGDGANEKAAELFDMLANRSELFTRLQYAVRVRDRRWDLEFGNGVKVLLPEEGARAAWARLSELQQERKILSKGVLAIDMRAPDRLFVRLREGDAEFLRTADNS
ncbi:MAG: FtsQ-type POTRA domain-containing protein [Sneathiella sp.]|nr:FtsQ-type POTRA domain-containing protein [Sneathiella sp.]